MRKRILQRSHHNGALRNKLGRVAHRDILAIAEQRRSDRVAVSGHHRAADDEVLVAHLERVQLREHVVQVRVVVVAIAAHRRRLHKDINVVGEGRALGDGQARRQILRL